MNFLRLINWAYPECCVPVHYGIFQVWAYCYKHLMTVTASEIRMGTVRDELEGIVFVTNI